MLKLAIERAIEPMLPANLGSKSMTEKSGMIDGNAINFIKTGTSTGHMRYALKFAYDGTAFDGYARQPNMKTVEGEIIKAMNKAKIRRLEDGELKSSSRTDKGVSSAGNVITISTDHDQRGIIPAINSKLDDIIFYGIKEVDEDFNPRHAVQRWYRYFLMDDEKYNENILLQNASIFLGEHDFRNFTKTDDRDENTVLAIDMIHVSREGSFIIIDFKARRFLWQLIRRLTASLLAMHDGKLDAASILESLSGNGEKITVLPVPPEGLVLMSVDYRFDFEHVEYPKNMFDTGIVKALTKTMVLKEIGDVAETGTGESNKN